MVDYRVRMVVLNRLNGGRFGRETAQVLMLFLVVGLGFPGVESTPTDKRHTWRVCGGGGCVYVCMYVCMPVIGQRATMPAL